MLLQIWYYNISFKQITIINYRLSLDVRHNKFHQSRLKTFMKEG